MGIQKSFKRRTFLSSLSTGLGIAALTQTSISAQEATRKPDRQQVWIGTMTLDRIQAGTGKQMVNKVINRMEQMLPMQPDIICIPETFPYKSVPNAPSVAGIAQEAETWILDRFSEFAKENHCYVICPLHTKEDGRVYNSAVLIDRQGKNIGRYHKIHPTTSEIEEGTAPGPVDPPVFHTDFGTIGIQICFDVNWHEGWRKLQKKGAEIIFWPSAFPGGRMLNAMAWINKAFIVTSTWSNPSRIIDISGEEIIASGRYQDWICAPVNLEKALVHIWPYTKNIESLQAKYGQKIRIKKLHMEGWGIIESVDPGLRIKDALAEFEIPLHTEHIQRADVMQEKNR